jgi:hypothetical protein
LSPQKFRAISSPNSLVHRQPSLAPPSHEDHLPRHPLLRARRHRNDDTSPARWLHCECSLRDLPRRLSPDEAHCPSPGLRVRFLNPFAPEFTIAHGHANRTLPFGIEHSVTCHYDLVCPGFLPASRNSHILAVAERWCPRSSPRRTCGLSLDSERRGDYLLLAMSAASLGVVVRLRRVLWVICYVRSHMRLI